ncbi:hypothetical protein GDO78_003945 [Eleutherodactylus coqui]|uniref:Uncharacterized protein n=1 Tax=Eleutherodactylus coqui TaxID=57060 RepID=A0A8J6ETU7_ELECQ|nr:hypothetical protein GDO78_003945 [Eleutherodactylus coqui]
MLQKELVVIRDDPRCGYIVFVKATGLRRSGFCAIYLKGIQFLVPVVCVSCIKCKYSLDGWMSWMSP